MSLQRIWRAGAIFFSSLALLALVFALSRKWEKSADFDVIGILFLLQNGRNVMCWVLFIFFGCMALHCWIKTVFPDEKLF